MDYAARPASDCPRYRLALHVYACVMVGLTLLLIVAGAMVTSTGSGLAVPDWPTTYGYNMFTFPYARWVGGVFYEHGHRLIASTVGFCTIILAVWLQRAEPRRWLRRLGWIALAAVIVQGILGGLTVRYLLPTPISAAHACLAQAFFCVLVSIAVCTSRGWIERPAATETGISRSAARLCLTAAIVIFMQLILGAIMRHTHSGLAVPDFPLAYGRVLPGLDAAAVAVYNEIRQFDYFLEPVSAAQIAWHLAHRAGAAAVTAVVAIAAWVVLRRHGRWTTLRRPMVVLPALVAAQILLGALTVLTGKVPLIASAHVAVGAATLGTAWTATLWAHRLQAAARVLVPPLPGCPRVPGAAAV